MANLLLFLSVFVVSAHCESRIPVVWQFDVSLLDNEGGFSDGIPYKADSRNAESFARA